MKKSICLIAALLMLLSSCSNNNTQPAAVKSAVSSSSSHASSSSSQPSNTPKAIIPITDEKTDFTNLVNQFNKESDTYGADLKSIRDLIIKAGNLEVYMECKPLPSESKLTTININVENKKVHKISRESKYQSLDEFYGALSQVWSANEMKSLKESDGWYYEYKGGFYILDEISCLETLNMPIVACTVKLVKKNSDGSAEYTVRLAQTLGEGFYSASKTNVRIVNEDGKLKVDTFLGGTDAKTGSCDTDIVGKEMFSDDFGNSIEKSIEDVITKGDHEWYWADNQTIKSYISDIRKNNAHYKLISCKTTYANCLAENANYEMITECKVQLTDRNGKVTTQNVKKVYTERIYQEHVLLNVTIS